MRRTKNRGKGTNVKHMLKAQTILWTIIIAVVVAFIAAPLPVMAQEDGETSGGLIIKAIEIRGNDRIDDRTIINVMKGRSGDAFSANILFDDLTRINDLGYFRTMPTQLKEPLEGGVKIIIIVEENPEFAGFQVEVIGVPIYTTDEIEDVFFGEYTPSVGELINNNDLLEAYVAVERIYRDEGYTAASITSAEVGEDGIIRLVIHEGIIHSITVEGLNKTKDHVILREVELKQGDIFNAGILRDNLQEVYNLQLFQDIEVDFGLTEDREVDLIIKVEEARTGQIGFGAGYSTEDGLLATFSYSELNFRGVGQKLQGNAQIGGPDPDFALSFFNPRIDKKNTSFSVEGYTTNTTNRERSLDDPDIFTRYTTSRRGGSAGVVRYLSNDVSLHFNLRFLSGDIEVTEGPPLQDVSEFARRGLIDGTSNAFSAKLTYDTRDFIFDPSEGSKFSIGTTLFGSLLGGDFDALKYEAEYSKYFLLNKPDEKDFTISPTRFRENHVIAFRLMLGAASGDLGLMDRFEVGGAMSLRGSDVAVQTGDKAMLFNAEYRFPVMNNMSAAVFFDSGTAAQPGDTLNFDNLIHCVGGGIRYHIPFFGVAPIRLEYGYDMTNGKGQFVFGFGQLF